MMPRKKGREDVPIDVVDLSPHKRHKKRKHKKHKRKRDLDQQDEPSPPGSPQSEGSKPSLKLKIRIGGLEKNVTKVDEASPEDALQGSAAKSTGDSSQESGDEEAWLEALESGRLDEVDDELRKMKDPTLMTARQRALLESKAQTKEREETVPAQPPQMSEEMLQRRMLRAKKRKQQAEEKKEKDKKQTIERLLKKSDSRLRGRKVARKWDAPRVSLVQRTSGTLLSFPVGVPFPLTPQTAPAYPDKRMCGIKGCPNPRKYCCSKTGLPLCSLECYKMNMLQMCV